MAAGQDYNVSTTNISIADLNGDGKLDMCTGKTIAGIISVFENTYAGIATTSSGITITATTIPSPLITLNINALASSAATGNQWYLNGVAIPGASDQTYQPVQTGLYTVTSTVNGCTSDFSASYNFILTGVISLGNGQYVNLYPNPIKNKLYINWNITNTPC